MNVYRYCEFLLKLLSLIWIVIIIMLFLIYPKLAVRHNSHNPYMFPLMNFDIGNVFKRYVQIITFIPT